MQNAISSRPVITSFPNSTDHDTPDYLKPKNKIEKSDKPLAS